MRDEGSKYVNQENFEAGLEKLLELAINGYPRALQTIAARRNECLRRFKGDQDAAVDDAKDANNTWAQEAKETLFGIIPGIGLPLVLVRPIWKMLRRACLIAALLGHD